MQRLLGVDLGSRRVGLALSDPLGITAQRLETLQVRTLDEAVRGIVEAAKQYGCEQIVIGLPRNMNGSEGEKAKESKKCAKKINEIADMEVLFIDERLTTVLAHKAITSTGGKKMQRRKKRKEEVDGIAAQLILQSYLDSQRPVLDPFDPYTEEFS